MTSVTFEHKVLLEQVRCIESAQALSDDPASIMVAGATGRSFDNRLLQRAQYLAKQNDLDDDLSHAAGIFRRSRLAATLVAMLLGAAATLTAVSGASTLNIYWLLLVLVGFNLLSMILWLVGVSVKMEKLTSGVLSRAAAWLPDLMSKRDTSAGRADGAWLACHLSGRVGKWRTSQITQQLWLVYLGAGLATLVMVLMARQFDFVWGTTLLSDASFVRLTTALGEPLQALGFATPNAQQVIETRIGSGFPLTETHRYNWAQFLIGTLLMCGILPRILLWIVCTLLLTNARQHFELDDYLPYYIALRQRLMPLRGESRIVDADSGVAPAPEYADALARDAGESNAVPTLAQWVAVELGDDIHWPLDYVGAEHTLGQVVDRSSLDTILATLHASKSSELAIAVAAARPPDRGLKRSIRSLHEAAADSWLVILQQTPEQPISESRLGAWYRLAQECQIPADNVVLQAGVAS